MNDTSGEREARPAGAGANVCAEFLSVYVDEHMRGLFKGATEAEIDEKLNKARAALRGREGERIGSRQCQDGGEDNCAPVLTPALTVSRATRRLYPPPTRPQVIVLFRFLHDKDVFEAFYKAHLQKRLLGEHRGAVGAAGAC
jgi:hypothetical protein